MEFKALMMPVQSIPKNFINKAWKPLADVWGSGDLSKKLTLALGVGSMALTPVGALGVYASEQINQDASKINFDSLKGKMFLASARLYPIVWTLVQAIIAGQSALAGSIVTTIDGMLLTLSSLFYDKVLYKRLNLNLQKKEAQADDGDSQSKITQLEQKLNKTDSVINFYTEAILVGLLSWFEEYIALPDLSKDIKPQEPHHIKPIESEKNLLNPKNYWERVKFNFIQETKAVRQAFAHIFRPSQWRGTLLQKNSAVENYIESKNLKSFKAWSVRLGSSALPTALACFAGVARLLSGVLFLSILPILGLKVFSQHDNSKEQKEHEDLQHQIAWNIFRFAKFLTSVVLLSSGIMSILMISSLSYRGFAGKITSYLQAVVGAFSIAAGSTQGTTERLLTFLTSMALAFAEGFRNIAGAKK